MGIVFKTLVVDNNPEIPLLSTMFLMRAGCEEESRGKSRGPTIYVIEMGRF